MRYRKRNQIIPAVLAFTAVTLAGYWSWNTLTGIFDLPRAEYHHAIAAFVMAALLRALLWPGRTAWRRHFAGTERSS